MADNNVKPYIVRIREWKIRNMVGRYLDAREQFRNYRKLLRKGKYLSFDNMREICDILFEIKEDHHLIYKRLEDPKKNKFENAQKYMPDDVELEFMNNIGLLFHKMLVARELKYLLEHYVGETTSFQKTRESLSTQLNSIGDLFEDGIGILKGMISRHKNNMLLLTLLLERADMVKRHFGKNAVALVQQFGNGKGLDEIYFRVGKHYIDCGRPEPAKKMLRNAIRKNTQHRRARALLKRLSGKREAAS